MIKKQKRWMCLLLSLILLLGTAVSCKSDPNGTGEVQTQPVETTITGTDEDGMKYTTVCFTDSGLAITPSYDVNGNIASFAHTREDFADVAKTFADMGVSRVYAVTSRPGIVGSSSAPNQWNDPGDNTSHTGASIILTGNPNFEFVYACHQVGLEVIAVFKPYEGGGVSKGLDADLSNCLYVEEAMGEYWTGYDTFISSHPEMRLSRKENAQEDAIVNDTITKIDAAFMLDAYTYKTWWRRSKTADAIADENVNTSQIKLYVSRSNVDYVEYPGDYKVEFSIENRKYLDENGWELFDGESRCAVATITGIEITSEYQSFALVMEDNTNRRIIAQSMIGAYNAEGERLPTTVGPYVRYKKGQYTVPDGFIWGDERTLSCTDPESLNYFAGWGFDFDFCSTGVNHSLKFNNAYVYGVTRGHFQYAKGTLCEVYPEVRQAWLDEVESYLMMGYDGIEIRLANHSYMISDFAYYGFNEPIIEEYKKRYGEDPALSDTVSKETAYRIALIRGDSFMEFMTAASEMTHKAGKVFGFQMRSGMLDPDEMDRAMDTTYHQSFDTQAPKIIISDWKAAVDLCDTITIKQNYANEYSSSLNRRLTDYAKSKDIQVWITAYTQQVTYVDEDGVQVGECNPGFFNAVGKDKNIYGIQLYEWDPKGARFRHAFQKIKEDQHYKPREVSDR